MKVYPVANMVLVLPCMIETKTKSGLFLPGNSDKAPLMGEIVNVGDKVSKTFKVGLTVLWEAYTEKKVVSDGQEHYLLKEENILGIAYDI